MQRFWSHLAVQLGKHAVWVSGIILVVTVILGAGITRLEFATGQDSYLNRGDQVAKDNVVYQDLFGGQAMLTVISMDHGKTIDELFTPDAIAQLEQFSKRLDASGQVKGVVSPLTALELSDSLVQSPDGNPLNSVAAKAILAAQAKEVPGSPAAEARTKDALTTLTRASAIPEDQRTFENPEWVKFLLYNNQGEVRKALRSVFVDDRHAQIVTRLPGNLSLQDEGTASELVKTEAAKLHFDNASTITTGAPVFLKDLNDYLRGGMLTLGAAAVVIMVLILTVMFRVRWRLLSLAVVIVGVIWAFGIAGYLGIPLTIVTIGGLPVMLGIGIDYAIQMHARVEEEVVVDRSPHPIQETARNLGPALLIVTFDAVFAFSALHFAKVPMIRDFGSLLAVGIIAICVCSILLPLAILGMREYRSPTQGRDFRSGPLGRLVVWLGGLSTRVAVPFAIASLVIFAAGIAVEGKLTLETDPVRWVNQQSQTVKDIRTVEAQVGSSAELGVYVTTKDDVFTDQFAQFAHDFTRDQLDRNGKLVLTGSSIETAIGDIVNDVPGGSDLAPRGEDVRAAYDVAPKAIRASTVSDKDQAFNVIFRVAPTSLDQRVPLVQEIRDDTKAPTGIRATPSGLAVVGVGLTENLKANRVELTYLAIGLVFAFLAIRLRSVIRALLSLVPVLIAVGVSSLVAYAFGLKLSPMTAVGGPLVIAACTEFTSLILLRFVEERRRGFEPREAMNETASRTGRAFVVSALTAISGVAVLSLSSLPLLRDFGRIVAMNVTVALLSALVVLPPLLVWAEKRKWVTRGLLDRPEVPFVPVPEREHF